MLSFDRYLEEQEVERKFWKSHGFLYQDLEEGTGPKVEEGLQVAA